MSAGQPIISGAGRANPQRAMVLLACLPIAGFLIFALTLALGYSRDRYAMIGLALLTTTIALIPVILDQARPAERRHMLLTLYCLLFIVHFGLPIFTHYAIVRMPTDPPGVAYASLFPPDIVAGQAVALLGLLSLLLGYAVLPLRLSDQEIERRKSRDWPSEVIVIVAAMMLVLGWVVTISGALGLIPAALGSGFISMIGSSVIFGNALLAVAALRHRSRIALIMLCIAVPVSSLLGFFTGSKTATLIVPAVVVFTAMLLGGRFRARWIVAGTMALAMLYPVAQFYRQDILRANTLTIVDVLSDPGQTLGVLSEFLSSSRAGGYLGDGLTATAARLDGIGIESVIVRDTPSVSPFQQGRTLALFPVAFIPRLLWPGKPEITLGQWITDTYGSGAHISSYTGPTFIGDLYLNFGVASVVIGMFVFGTVLRFFQTRFLGPHPTAVGILAAIVLIAQLIIKQIGSAAAVMSTTVFALAPVMITYFAVAYLVRGNSTPREPSWSEQDDAGVGGRF
ncbi:MAG: hypothetical protein ABGX04_10680 [Myxococcales bacterium]|nr:oligosaccharide repeat unit polymerase [Myxococcales bacterium]HIK83964.1 oligosaccharide repeat unit polymerase [Myxococcales bacterium]